eukprot:Phypoly_transcript_08760.p1 GENE.Phypoly_transcript_08760~~Phypoly_transcript_08760.p1  ORF type:complete len:294 (+),score=14.25 Phypoly_transcript_08760:112-993(+)
MVRYEPPSIATRCCFPLVHGLRRPFKPKIVRFLLASLFWLLAFAWMIVCGNLSAFRSLKEHSTLPDLLFSILPHRKVAPLPDIFLYTLLTSAIGRMIFHKDGVAIARRFATIAGCTYILRGLTLVATSLPYPQAECQTLSTSTWTLSLMLTDACGDMMGHTVNVVLAALAWSQYTHYRIISIFAWLTSIAAMILFLVDRSHYTIDILMSLCIAVFCWKQYHMVLRLPTNSQNSVVQWMEKLDGATVGDVIERQREAGPRENGISLTTVVNEALGAPLAGPSKYKELLEEDRPA